MVWGHNGRGVPYAVVHKVARLPSFGAGGRDHYSGGCATAFLAGAISNETNSGYREPLYAHWRPRLGDDAVLPAKRRPDLSAEGVTGRRPGLRSAVVSMGESTGRYRYGFFWQETSQTGDGA
jgi:hypothetical protein